MTWKERIRIWKSTCRDRLKLVYITNLFKIFNQEYEDYPGCVMQTVNFTKIEISSLHNTTNLISVIIKSNILKKTNNVHFNCKWRNSSQTTTRIRQKHKFLDFFRHKVGKKCILRIMTSITPPPLPFATLFIRSLAHRYLSKMATLSIH